MEQKLHTHVDFYELLGIDRKADSTEVKRAYRTLVKQYHPDLNKDPGAPQAFRTIQSAYEVLSDPYKRSVYDYLLYRQEQQVTEQDYSHHSGNGYYRRRPYAHYADATAAREARDEPETFGEHLNFHLKQFVGLIISVLVFCVSLVLIVTGVNFLFLTDFNGSLVAGYFTTGAGIALLYGIYNAFKVLIRIWYDWFEHRQQSDETE